MTRPKFGLAAGVALAGLGSLSTTALAQGSAIAGVAKDPTGGVLPGVRVEAASDVLIEGVKSAVTDGSGQFKLVELRPGIYTVTFALEGFTTVKTTGIEVPADQTTTLNTEMSIGSLENTITVTADRLPFVDIQSAAKVQTLDREAMNSIPTSRTIQSMATVIPGITVSGAPDVGGSNAAIQTFMTVRGVPAAQNTVMVDGMVVNGVDNNGATQGYFNDAASEQIVYQTSNTTASNSGGGVQVNMIPREGGNRFSGDSQFAYRPGQWQGDNLTERLKALRVATLPGEKYISDLTFSQGGPIRKNTLWFFASTRDNRLDNYVLNTFFDDGTPGHNAEFIKDVLGRVTYQANSRIKVSGYYDRVWKDLAHAMAALTDPETAAISRKSRNYSTGSVKGTWSVSNRLVIEGGRSFNTQRRDNTSTGGVIERQMDDPVLMGTPGYQTNAWYRGASETGAGGRRTSSAVTFQQEYPQQATWQGSASFVSGSHYIKGGFQLERGFALHTFDTHGDLTESYDSGVQDPVTHNWTFSLTPTQCAVRGCAPSGAVTIRNTPLRSQERMNQIAGYYIQDQWTFKRLTLNGGLRYETVRSQVDETAAPAGRFVPARTQPEVTGRPNWTDWAPRSSVVLDVFGNGKTAIKYSLNRYNAAETTTTAEGFNVMSSSTSVRQWTDLNNDGIAQGQRVWSADGTSYTDCPYQTAGCEIYLSGSAGVNPVTGAPQTLTALPGNFGLPGSLPVYSGAPRLYRIEQGVEVQHQVTARVGVTFSYTHWDRHNNTTVVNTARQAPDADYTPFQFFNPIDGTALPFLYYNITAAANARQSASGVTTTIVEPKLTMRYDGYQMDFRARPWSRAQIFGGITVQRTLTRDCETSQAGLFVDPNALRYCDTGDMRATLDGPSLGAIPWTTAFKFAASFPLTWGMTFSATYQNLDLNAFNRIFTYGRTTNRYPDGSANYVTAAGTAVPATPCPSGQAVCAVPGSLSAPPTLTSTSVSLPIDPPGFRRDERLSQLDIKLSKQFRLGRLRFSPTLETFNLLNADTIIGRSSLAYPSSNTGTSTYLQPSAVLKPRLVGVGALLQW